jgi:hypothetical protein
MGAADDIRSGLTKSLKNFTKQRKAEERHSSAGRWRMSRMMEVRGMFLNEAADKVIREAYLKASDNNTLPATARQIFYVVRPLIEEQTDRELQYSYFSQTLMPNYISEHATQCADWDVVYDDRGHFMEPHTKLIVGLGTLNVRKYLNRVGPLRLEDADFVAAKVKSCGPNGSFGALLYVEKEGFSETWRRVKLAKRYDIGIMSSKGMSVTAARQLADGICGRMGIPLLVLHDFDRPGIVIKDTLENDTRRFSYSHALNVIDLGLHYDDIDGLPTEPASSNITDERLERAGLDADAINFLNNKRVELNAMTARLLVDFVEDKLKQHGIQKVIPDDETLAETYRMFTASDRLSEAFDEMKKAQSESEAAVKVPDDLKAKVAAKLQEQPDLSWHRALQHIVDPDAPDNEDDDEDGEIEDDDDDLNDVDE